MSGDEAEVMGGERLPEGWTESPIRDLLAYLPDGNLVHQGWSPKCHSEPAPEGQWGVLKTTAIQDGYFLAEQNKRLPEHLEPKPRLEVQEGDILLTCAGPRIRCGVPTLVRETRNKLLISGKMYRMRANPVLVTPVFLAAFLRTPETQLAIDSMKTGMSESGMNITHDRFSTLTVPLPPLAEQIRIADKLDALLARVEAGRERLERVPKLLKRFRQSVLSAAVSGELTREWRGGGDAEWEATTLGLCGSVSGGLTKNAKRHELPLKRPYLRVANVQTNYLALEDVAEIGLTEAEWQKTRLIKDDLLIVEGNGSLEHLGRVAIWGSEVENCSHQNHLIRWRAKNAEPRFVLYALLSPQGRGNIVEIASTTTGLHTLSISKVAALPVLLPPLPEQAEIVHRVEALFVIADRLEQRYAQALSSFDSLTPALLAKAFRGELVPQDPTDEPASVLLERIRAQRAAGGEKPRRGRGAGAGAGKRGRPRKEPEKETAGIPEAGSVEEAIRLLEARKQERAAPVERAEGTRLVGLFSEEG